MNVYLVNSRFTEPAGKGVLALSILFASSLPALLWGLLSTYQLSDEPVLTLTILQISLAVTLPELQCKTFRA
jgi:hypothetical protein